MLAASIISITDLSRQKKLSLNLSDEITPGHTVDQTIDHYLEAKRIPKHGQRWVAVTRGRRLDNKLTLAELPDVDVDWRVLPEAVAGASDFEILSA